MELQTITNILQYKEIYYIGSTLEGTLYSWKFDCMKHKDKEVDSLSAEVQQIYPLSTFTLPPKKKIYKLKLIYDDAFIM